MHSQETMQAARLAQLEGAILGLLRDAVADGTDGYDGLTVVASADEGQVVIDLTYTINGLPIAGESL